MEEDEEADSTDEAGDDDMAADDTAPEADPAVPEVAAVDSEADPEPDAAALEPDPDTRGTSAWLGSSNRPNPKRIVWPLLVVELAGVVWAIKRCQHVNVFGDHRRCTYRLAIGTSDRKSTGPGHVSSGGREFCRRGWTTICVSRLTRSVAMVHETHGRNRLNGRP